MNEALVRVEQKDDGYYLRGVIDFTTAPLWLARTKELFSKKREIVLDLSGITKSNSAGIGLLIEWMRIAKRHGCQFRVRACPESLMHLARAGGVDELLSLTK